MLPQQNEKLIIICVYKNNDSSHDKAQVSGSVDISWIKIYQMLMNYLHLEPDLAGLAQSRHAE